MDGIKYRKIEDMKANTGDWFGQIPIEWEKCRIKDYFSDISERNYLSNATLLSLYTDFGIRRTEDITNLRGNKSQTVLEYKKVKIDDIVVNKMLAWMGASGRSNYDGVVSAAYSVYRLKNKNAEIRLFHYMFRDKRFAGECFKNGWGIMLMRWTVTPERFRSIYIPVPKLNQQQKIANFLDIKTAQFDSIIAKKELLIQKLEEAKKSLISEVVTGKVKIIDGEMVPRQPEEMKDSGVEWLGMIPKDWTVSKLSNLAIRITDGAHISPETDDGMYPFLSVKDLKNNQLDFENCLLTSNRSYKYLARNSCNPRYNDVLFSKDGSIGQTTVVDFDKQFIVASSLVIITPIKTMNSYYFEHILNSNFFQEQIKMFTKGAALPRISLVMLKNSKVLCTTNSDEQAIIVSFLNKRTYSIDKTISQITTQIQKLKQAKQSLISEAVTGKIDLRDWEIMEAGEVQ